MQAKHAERFYLPELDVLRFFAFFGVFFCHLPAPFALKFFDSPGAIGALGKAGAFGVDLFFTLSGYLITSLLLRERDESGDINLKAFYARRTLRIWPLYYFSIGLAFLLTQLPASFASGPQLYGNLFAPMKPGAYFFMAIFLYNFNFNSTLLTNPPPFMGLLWSISVEEQFYFFWPWFVRYVPRKRIVLLPIAMIAIGCAIRASLTFDLNRLVWNYTFAHFDSIAVGILIALLPSIKLTRGVRLLLVLAGISSWLFAAGWCGIPYEHGTLKISMGYPAVALGSGAFLLAMLGAESLRRNSAPVRMMVYLGKISYGLYVYNAIAYSAAAVFVFRGIPLEDGRPLMALSLYALLSFTLNVALAAISYRWLEAPFLRLKERFTRVPSRAV